MVKALLALGAPLGQVRILLLHSHPPLDTLVLLMTRLLLYMHAHARMHTDVSLRPAGTPRPLLPRLPACQVIRGRPLLHHAAACGAATTVRWLGSECSAQLPLDSLDGKGRTPLRLAAAHSHLEAAQVLVRLGASPVVDAHLTLSDEAVSDEVRLFVGTAVRQWRRGRGELLLMAAASNSVTAMRALHVEQNADLLHTDERGYSALHHAVANGHEEATLYLLQTAEAGALSTLSTAQAGATANWLPADLSSAPRVSQMLRDFAQGGEERGALIKHARRRLVQQLSPAATRNRGLNERHQQAPSNLLV